jgi:rhomboid family GlyGly-CTERM serine protease
VLPSANRLFSRGRRFGAPALLAALACLLYFVPGAGRALEYDRAAIASGQLWRILTAHWTHSSLDHLAWDVIVFAVLGAALAARHLRLFVWIMVVSPVAISGALLWIGPQWHIYRGLSGVDSALFAALSTVLWREWAGKERWFIATALLLFSGKIALEAATGVALFATDLSGQDVVPLAHLAGGAGGLFCALLRRQDATPGL